MRPSKTAFLAPVVRSAFALAIAGAACMAQAADLLDTVKSRGTLRIGAEATYPPFNFKDQKTGELTGFDADVARLVASKLGVKPEFVTTEWSGILAGLAAGKFDVIVNQVGITEERKRTFDFSEPYTISSAQLILNRDDTRNFKGLDDLKGKRVGVGQGSNYEKKAKAVPGVEVKSYPGAPEYLQDLAAKRIDAALNDSLMVNYLIKTSNLPLKAGAPIGDVEKMGIPFKKDNPKFKAAIDKAISDAKADGSLKAISMKWFGVDVTQPPSAR
ncbi:cystine ABC transporter substrate-binding protein [Oxalobacteraceae bacterium OM1]|nr:cystine ABC transporter substrate-binding protein [Oxalobacteraceae bacterium OM1]